MTVRVRVSVWAGFVLGLVRVRNVKANKDKRVLHLHTSLTHQAANQSMKIIKKKNVTSLLTFLSNEKPNGFGGFDGSYCTLKMS